jgi:tetratricopeptide (TPR) repeat protein
MMFKKKPQLISIVLAVFLIVLLLLLPRVETVDKENPEDVPETADLDEKPMMMANEDVIIRDHLLEEIRNMQDPLDKIDLYDSLASFYESRGFIFQAAKALGDIADIVQDKPSRFIAGDKYFLAFQNGREEFRRQSLQKAIESYQKVLDENPEDLEAMTSLGVCYVEGAQLTGEPPMKGIGMLRKVLELDPDNINAMINLGYFAVKSGQYDKAEERFVQVLEIDPDYADAYLYLSDLYLKTGERDKAIEMIERYRVFITDPEMIQQLNDYIEQIRTNN